MINLNTVKSWSFLLLVLTNAAAWLATAGSTVSPKNAVLFSAASAGAYALSRGLAKVNADGRPVYQTTEFWVAILGAATAVVGNLNGTLPDSTMKLVLAALAGLSVVANGLRQKPAEQVP